MIQDKHTLQATHQLLVKIESDVEHRTQNLKTTQKRIDLLMTFFFILIGIFALLNLYFLYDWGQEVRSIVYEMEGLIHHITTISHQMMNMGDTVQKLETTTALIPIMNEEMSKFVGSMSEMQQQTQAIHLNMSEMNASFSGISQDMTQMNTQVKGLNQQIGQISTNVHEMSRVIP